jgi:sulfate adenylyltransferase subunit 1 (EFTu-like GTPase family)
MLELPHVVYTVNKMDLVGYAEERFDEIVRELAGLGAQLGLHDARMIPISALKGDNVVDRTEAMPWYDGPTLLEHLETVEVAADRNEDDRRFPVQWVVRPMADEHHDYRGYAGQVASGTWRAGDEVVVLPSGLRSTVAAVDTSDGPLDEAVPGQSVTILLEDDVDVSRGDLLADPARPPAVAREVTARVCWMSERPVEERARLLVKHTTRTVTARIDEIVSVVDIHTLEDLPAPGRMELNDLGVVRLRLAEPLAVDPYAQNRATGAFILVDEATNETVGAGMVTDAVA